VPSTGSPIYRFWDKEGLTHATASVGKMDIGVYHIRWLCKVEHKALKPAYLETHFKTVCNVTAAFSMSSFIGSLDHRVHKDAVISSMRVVISKNGRIVIPTGKEAATKA